MSEVRIRYLIRDPLRELYWVDLPADTNEPDFTMYTKKATKFKTEQEAVDAIYNKVPKDRVYIVDKLYAKI
jgi:hypothetical protein